MSIPACREKVLPTLQNDISELTESNGWIPVTSSKGNRYFLRDEGEIHGTTVVDAEGYEVEAAAARFHELTPVEIADSYEFGKQMLEAHYTVHDNKVYRVAGGVQ